MELQRILKAVSEVTEISENDILSKNRLKETVLARHLYCYFALYGLEQPCLAIVTTN